MLDSFAVVLDVKASTLADEIGHHGLDGFHSQELIDCCLRRGRFVTPIERRPVGQHPATLRIEPLNFREGNENRFARHLSDGNGVLMGRQTFSAKPHAVAWIDGLAFDPALWEWYTITDPSGRPDDVYFTPMTFLRID